MNIEQVWNEIKSHQGERFSLIRGKEFTYKIIGDFVFPSTLKTHGPSKSELEKALAHLPLDSTVSIQHLWGPSYIFALLTDKRIVQ